MPESGPLKPIISTACSPTGIPGVVAVIGGRTTEPPLEMNGQRATPHTVLPGDPWWDTDPIRARVARVWLSVHTVGPDDPPVTKYVQWILGEEPEEYRNDQVRSLLGEALVRVFQGLEAALPVRSEDPGDWNKALFTFLEDLGAGPLVADLKKSQAGQDPGTADGRWYLWATREVDPGRHEHAVAFRSRALRNTARALWGLQVKPRYDRLVEYKTPALTRTVVEALEGIAHRGQRLEGDHVVYGNRETGLLAPDQVRTLARKLRIPALTADLVEQKLAALATVPGWKLVRHLARVAFEQTLLRPKHDFRRVTVEGGLDQLRKTLGSASKEDATALRDALDALQVVQLPVHGGGHVSVLMWDSIPAAPGQRSELRITLGDPLIPGFGYALEGKGRSHWEAARLVPSPPPELMPPLVGSRRTHGAQATLQMTLLRELSDRSIELVEAGGVHLGEQDWLRLADEAGVPQALVDRIRNAWTSPGNGWLFPFLELLVDKRDVYTLGDAFPEGRDFLVQQGRDRLASAQGGKESARKKREGRARIANPRKGRK